MDRIEPLLAKLKTTKALTTDEAVIVPSALSYALWLLNCAPCCHS